MDLKAGLIEAWNSVFGSRRSTFEWWADIHRDLPEQSRNLMAEFNRIDRLPKAERDRIVNRNSMHSGRLFFRDHILPTFDTTQDHQAARTPQILLYEGRGECRIFKAIFDGYPDNMIGDFTKYRCDAIDHELEIRAASASGVPYKARVPVTTFRA